MCFVKLMEDGPHKREIFRAPGSCGNIKELLHSLHQGKGTKDLSRTSTHAIASVIKIFLQKLPGGLFGPENEKQLFELENELDLNPLASTLKMKEIITRLSLARVHFLTLFLGTLKWISIVRGHIHYKQNIANQRLESDTEKGSEQDVTISSQEKQQGLPRIEPLILQSESDPQTSTTIRDSLLPNKDLQNCITICAKSLSLSVAPSLLSRNLTSPKRGPAITDLSRFEMASRLVMFMIDRFGSSHFMPPMAYTYLSGVLESRIMNKTLSFAPVQNAESCPNTETDWKFIYDLKWPSFSVESRKTTENIDQSLLEIGECSSSTGNCQDAEPFLQNSALPLANLSKQDHTARCSLSNDCLLCHTDMSCCDILQNLMEGIKSDMDITVSSTFSPSSHQSINLSKCQPLYSSITTFLSTSTPTKQLFTKPSLDMRPDASFLNNRRLLMEAKAKLKPVSKQPEDCEQFSKKQGMSTVPRNFKAIEFKVSPGFEIGSRKTTAFETGIRSLEEKSVSISIRTRVLDNMKARSDWFLNDNNVNITHEYTQKLIKGKEKGTNTNSNDHFKDFNYESLLDRQHDLNRFKQKRDTSGTIFGETGPALNKTITFRFSGSKQGPLCTNKGEMASCSGSPASFTSSRPPSTSSDALSRSPSPYFGEHPPFKLENMTKKSCNGNGAMKRKNGKNQDLAWDLPRVIIKKPSFNRKYSKHQQQNSNMPSLLYHQASSSPENLEDRKVKSDENLTFSDTIVPASIYHCKTPDADIDYLTLGPLTASRFTPFSHITASSSEGYFTGSTSKKKEEQTSLKSATAGCQFTDKKTGLIFGAGKIVQRQDTIVKRKPSKKRSLEERDKYRENGITPSTKN
ncbi:unnamed protein product [Gordionus sp. m RMFG-2023]